MLYVILSVFILTDRLGGSICDHTQFARGPSVRLFHIKPLSMVTAFGVAIDEERDCDDQVEVK